MRPRGFFPASVITFLIFPGALFAESPSTEARKEFLQNITAISVESPRREDKTVRPIIDDDWAIWPSAEPIEKESIQKALSGYDVVTEDEWSHPLAHLLGGNQGWTGKLILREGEPLRWMMPQEGILVIRWADHRWLYLLDRTLRSHPEQEAPWEPTTARSARLDFPGSMLRCEAAAVTKQEANACIAAIITSRPNQVTPVDVAAGSLDPDKRIPVSITVEPAKPAFGPNEPILLYVRIFNRMAGPVWFSSFSLVPNNWNGEIDNCGLVDIYRGQEQQSINLNRLEPAKEAIPKYIAGQSRSTIDANGSLAITLDARKWKVKGGWVAGNYTLNAQVSNIEVDERTSLTLLSDFAAFTIAQPAGAAAPAPQEATLDDFINE